MLDFSAISESIFSNFTFGSSIVTLILMHFVAVKLAEIRKIPKDRAQLAWVPIYGDFVLSRLATGSYKLAWVNIFVPLATAFVCSFGTFALMFLGISEGVLLGTIILVFLITILVSLAVRMLLYKEILKHFGYGWGVTILMTLFTTITTIVVLLSHNPKKEEYL